MVSDTPMRIQQSRKKGWRKPAGAAIVSRPSRWGNPYRVGPYTGYPTAQAAVDRYRAWLAEHAELMYPIIREKLRGKDLACWCKLGDPCHADVLLEIANAK